MTVYDDIKAERAAQDHKWGVQNHPDVPSTLLWLYGADGARDACELAFKNGKGTWAHILVEEVAEAIEAPTVPELREELVQIAAVAAAWVEAIDRRVHLVDKLP